MPARKPQRPATRAGSVPTGGDTQIADVPRQLGGLAAAVRTLENRAKDRSRVVVDLVIGENVITHNLGRRPIGAGVTPSAATLSFGWALTATSSAQCTITVVGSDMPSATVEVF